VQSAYTPYLGDPSPPTHDGQRAVQGQRAMQVQSDPFLGWTTIGEDDYLVRQLNDHKAGLDLAALKAGLAEYAALCGETLARGHARAGDAGLIAGYLGTSQRFDEAIGAFAAAYAEQTEQDCHALRNDLGRQNKPKPVGRKSSTRKAPGKKKNAAKR
jgi:hypothetical protein